MKKICFVTASSLSLRVFMRNHMVSLAERYEVIAVADFSDEDLLGDWAPGVRLEPISIKRPIDLVADLSALFSLSRLFYTERFDVVHSVTPKAGMLAMTASRLSGVPHRVHCFTGQVWATRKGVGRALLKAADRIIAENANHILADSGSQRQFLEREGILQPGQAIVLGSGSISGVDIDRFRPNADVRNRIRTEWGVPPSGCLLLFVGRLNRDKGILDLAQAFAELSRERDDVWLAVVGPDESGINGEFQRLCGASAVRVRRISYTNRPEDSMAAADIFVLPSYREGFGSVVIEAAACGVPSVASRIYGLTDAIDENITGLMYPPRDVPALTDCLRRCCADSTLRLEMGSAARARVQAKFSMYAVTTALLDFYEKDLAAENGC